MAAENIAQKRQDGLQILQTFGENAYIEPRMPLIKALELFDIRNPESWLRQSEAPIPPLVLKILADAGVDPMLIDMAVRSGQQADPMLPTPGVNDQAAAEQQAAM
jgi:hypothetical protein